MATSDKRRQAEDNREGHVGRATITIDGEHEDAPAEGNDYAAKVKAGHTREARNQKIFIMGVVLVALYAFALVVPKNIISTATMFADNGYTISWFILQLQDNLNGILTVVTGNLSGTGGYDSTMIRYVIIAFTGAGMALCGAVYQGSFNNSLVSPSTLGVMSGASAGMIFYVVFMYDSASSEFLSSSKSSATAIINGAAASSDPLSYIINSYGLALCSFIGCMLVVSIVILVLKLGRGGNSAIFMIITGQVMGGVIGAVTNSVRYYYLTVDTYGEKAQLLQDLMIASFFRNYTWIDLVAIGVPLVITFIVVMALRQKMMLLSADATEQRAMGIESKRVRYAVLALCMLLTALIVSFCGQVGFVGFLVPHLARRIVGPNFKYLLPASTVLGAIFVLGAYTILMVTLGPDYETMVGMFISIAGAAVFLVTALRGGGNVRGQFR